MLLVGDSAHSGISTYYNNYYVREVSLAVNPSYTYNEMYGSYSSGMQSAFDNAIIDGVGIFNYRGYIGMSGWTPSAATTTNGLKLNHGVFVTCDTGTFYSGDSRTELYTRIGSSSVPAGGVTAIGMATASTHTAINSFLCTAIFDGIYNRGMRSMGESLLYTRNYLQTIYGISSPTNAYNFKRYCNLIGDPTVEVFVTIPKTFTVTPPASTFLGTTSLEFTVKDASGTTPIANAAVTVWQSGTLNLTEYTNASGKVVFTIPATITGSITATVSKHDYKPTIQTVTIAGTGLVYQSTVIDDDMSAGTIGNSNGIINAGETIDYKINLKNTTASSITSTSGTLTCSDTYITISSATMTFGTITAGSTVLNAPAARFSVSRDCPDNHPVTFIISGTSSTGAWSSTVKYIVRSPDIDYVSHTINGTNAFLEPGETTTLYTSVINNGTESVSSVYGVLRSLNSYVVVTDSLKSFGTIAGGASFSNSAVPFGIQARSSSVCGMTIPMQLYLYNASGFKDTESFTLTIGNSTLTDPLGQDTYGYLIYDDGDVSYPLCPTYNWMGIAPEEGGVGTALAISDLGASGDEGDQVGCDATETVTLPFTFKYYGVNYNQITVISNGYVVFGTTANADWRNGRIPGAAGPNAMIAPFWDDLSTMTGGIYTYYNSAMSCFVIEWYNLRNGFNRTSEETFQVILYNPSIYPTVTGDGPIKIQYKVFNNVDNSSTTSNHGNYCTIGLKDHTDTRGLEYTYNNQYPTAAKPIANLSALYITTPLATTAPYININQTNVSDANSNGLLEPGESLNVTLNLKNLGETTATSVTATISESDPWITITQPTASFGTIAGLGNATNATSFGISVVNGCPNNYEANVTVTINATGYSCTRSFFITLSAPQLVFGNMTILDPSPGNNNGTLDPGETVSVSIPLSNTGVVASSAGSATLGSTTTGITINTGTAGFSAISGAGSTVLTFNITASPSMVIGTLAALNFNATASVYTASKSANLEIGAPFEVTIGTGIGTQTYPLNRYYNYSAHEAIYLASEIGMAGSIKSIGYYRASGTDLSGIEAVQIYMKNTSESTLSSGDYSTTGYTLVYSGTYPNDVTTGWLEVNLSPLFEFNGYSNLSILIVKGFQQYVSTYPSFNYSTTATNRARQSQSDTAAPTSLTQTTNLPNLKLKIFRNNSVLYPPQNLTYSISHQSVKLDWTAPLQGTPTSYNIYKNSTLLTSVSGLTYTDTAVSNGTSYAYYLKANYSGTESAATTTINATPNAAAPTNLVAAIGDRSVSLTWTGATGFRSNIEDTKATAPDRSISGYKVYRNSSAITGTISSTSYLDTNVTNDVTYSYFVTTVYASPAGESAASNTVNATPTANPLITIGTGTSLKRQPFGMYDGYERDASLYLSSEIGSTGSVQTLSWNVGTAYASAAPVIIRMATTTSTSLTSTTWASMITDATTVYTGTAVSFSSVGWKTITLDTPFAYTSGNLIVMIETNYGANGTSSYPYFYYTVSPTGTHQKWYADNNPPTTSGLVDTSRPNIQLQLGVISASPVFSLSPSSLAFGSVYIGTSLNRTFTITNSGGGTLSGTITTPNTEFVVASARNVIDATNHDVNERNRNAISYSIASGLSNTFTLTYTPTGVNNYNVNVSISSNDTGHLTNNLAVTGTGVVPVFNPPTLVTASSDNGEVTLHWTAPTGGAGTLSGYKVYRNSGIITSDIITTTYYYDTDVTNETIYSYYVTAIYTLPSGESSASESVTAKPTANMLVIGNGSVTNQSLPIEPYYGYTYSQTIYLQSEINLPNRFIYNIAWFYNGNSAWNGDSIKIWMGHTSMSSFTSTSDWNSISNLTLVYDGTISAPASAGWIDITLNTPFDYNNTDNLLVAVDENTTGYHLSADDFLCTAVTGTRSIYFYNDNTNPDPTSPPTTGTYIGTSTYIPNVKLLMGDIPAAPVVTIETWGTGVKVSWPEVEHATKYFVLGSSEVETGYELLGEVTNTEFLDATPINQRFYKVIAANGTSTWEPARR